MSYIWKFELSINAIKTELLMYDHEISYFIPGIKIALAILFARDVLNYKSKMPAGFLPYNLKVLLP